MNRSEWMRRHQQRRDRFALGVMTVVFLLPVVLALVLLVRFA